MSDTEKKKNKTLTKALKKELKYKKKLAKKTGQLPQESARQPSRLIRFAEYVRGILYLIFSVSLMVAILTSGKIKTLTTSEIVKICIGSLVGKVVLAVIAVALFIYGLKYLRSIK